MSDEGASQLAIYIAMVVRNSMEDFHCEHLTDQQMATLNPIIRNAIYTALYAFDHKNRSDAAEDFVNFHARMIPRYWEKPELTEDYRKLLAQHGSRT